MARQIEPGHHAVGSVGLSPEFLVKPVNFRGGEVGVMESECIGAEIVSLDFFTKAPLAAILLV